MTLTVSILQRLSYFCAENLLLNNVDGTKNFQLNIAWRALGRVFVLILLSTSVEEFKRFGILAVSSPSDVHVYVNGSNLFVYFVEKIITCVSSSQFPHFPLVNVLALGDLLIH